MREKREGERERGGGSERARERERERERLRAMGFDGAKDRAGDLTGPAQVGRRMVAEREREIDVHAVQTHCRARFPRPALKTAGPQTGLLSSQLS